MDIQTTTLGKGSHTSSSFITAKATGSAGVNTKPEVQPESIADEANKQPGTKAQTMFEQDVAKATDNLNKIMQLVNADLKFEIHEKTQRLMVRLVDTKTDTVLKEFPPHELLDTLGAIREYIGILLDKKA
ncbi:flagellar protein FlaG [Sporomusa sphaeroides DSM 2875]|uniref:flagellar protein FlaG n=1 Tax=Sporomusa sphaeroides TaxID=47679 RepID=UPI0020300DA6|nr:flagellar protein FlaG [Sporomusa sphaeroides]MCM0761008.1 flagellar protein FlaG [Sporomusa sphaeroides DSM 2875]